MSKTYIGIEHSHYKPQNNKLISHIAQLRSTPARFLHYLCAQHHTQKNTLGMHTLKAQNAKAHVKSCFYKFHTIFQNI